ncbi:MAG TPA: helix-turn-helix transcriptional regulator [Solimonas sp.]
MHAQRNTRVDAEMALRVGRVQLVRNVWHAPIDQQGAADDHHLELSLLPNTGEPRGCFPDLWGPQRFEPIGEIFLLPAAQMFHARSQCRQQHSLICRFDPRAVDEWFDGELRWTDGRLRGGLNIVSRRIRMVLSGIAEELRQPGFASNAMVDLMAAQAAIELSRHLLGLGDGVAVGGLAVWQLRRIDERIAGDPLPPSLNELAQLCGISPRHLTRAFRASRGCSIGEHLAAHRIEQSRQMLAAGSGVKAVAYTLGFTAPSNFAAAFRRATGESPRQYQQRSARAIRKH